MNAIGYSNSLKRHIYFAIIFLSLAPLFCILCEEQNFPVLYKARYRPVKAYARLWLYDDYHASSLRKADLTAFHTTSQSPIQLLWSLEFLGHTRFKDAPLFWIRSAELKKMMGLAPKQDRFSYNALSHFLNSNEKSIAPEDKKLKEEWSALVAAIKEFEQLEGSLTSVQKDFEKKYRELKEKKLGPKEIGRLLDIEFPLNKRLESSTLFKALPGRYKEGDWLPLHALKTKIYDQKSGQLKPIGNFTIYSDKDFDAIALAYQKLEQAFAAQDKNLILTAEQHLSQALASAYKNIAGSIVQKVHEKQLNYPSLMQLKVETEYVQHHWIPLLILIYAIGACLLLVSYKQSWPLIKTVAMWTICLAVVIHTLLLAIRCYILQRPPVSNMFETVIYVPWVTACVALLFPVFRKSTLALLAASLSSIGLLVILEVTDLNQNLDQVQAVLDSQFWLLIHVLLVVGSYGIFIFGAILGHFYLGIFMTNPKKEEVLKNLSWMILQSLYAGVAMLIAGTILGGIWAAQSWGRFWDWDPKESWAFISSCFYLIWIHAYRFHKIASFGLAIGAVIGLLAISFTWYGVNYILGTGLHSYGFGSGGEHFYYAFVIAECLFVLAALLTNYYRKKSKFLSSI